MTEGAFDGIRVIELAQWVFVPVAGALLADWGADVVRIDRPEGDPYRSLATQGIGSDSGGVNLSVALANRGKRSIALDVRSEGGQRILHQLLATADVFLTSLRPDALQRLGLDADQLRTRYPALVYARGNGYGMRGPDAGMAGYDATAFFARGGVAHVLTPADRDYPITQRGAMGDRNAGMALAFGIACVAEADSNRRGVHRRCVSAWRGDVDVVVGPVVGAAGPYTPRPSGPGWHGQPSCWLVPDERRAAYPIGVPGVRSILDTVLRHRRTTGPARRPAVCRPPFSATARA